MALTADLTFVHMEAQSVIDRIEDHLHQLTATGRETENRLRTLDQIAHQSVRLRGTLADFFERERQELLPRIRRICGAETEEISSLLETQQNVISSLDQFIASVDDGIDESSLDLDAAEQLREHFRCFAECFDHRCELERNFYQSFSTILFPGGVATD